MKINREKVEEMIGEAYLETVKDIEKAHNDSLKNIKPSDDDEKEAFFLIKMQCLLALSCYRDYLFRALINIK